jgi:hypothetical protein
MYATCLHPNRIKQYSRDVHHLAQIQFTNPTTHAPNLVEQFEQLKAKIGQLDARLDAIFKILIYGRTSIEREDTRECIRVGMFDSDTCNRILEQYDRELESIDTMCRIKYTDIYKSI